jgi:phosphoribosylanthranilate isomerase
MPALTRPAVKVCGLTRPADVELAESAGADYVGAILAGGPRHLDGDVALQLLGTARRAGRVAVFGGQSPDAIARLADAGGLAAVQLHGGATAETLSWLGARIGAARWAVVRVRGATFPHDEVDALGDVADAVVLDAHVEGALGGTGTALPWGALAEAIAAWRTRVPGVRFVLAGGLRAEVVGTAIRCLAPDVVDVSSGVEQAPGIKEPGRLRAFLAAVESVDG